MIRFLKNNQFLSVSIKNSTQVILRFVISVLNIKIIAIFVGTNGMALVSQLQNFLQLGVAFSGAGINDGIVKNVAQYHYSNIKQGVVISTGFVIVSLASLMFGAVVFFIPGFISDLIFESDQYIMLIKFSGVYFTTTSLLNLFVSVLNGMRRLKIFILLNSFLTVSGFIIVFSSLYFYGLNGLMWGMVFQTSIAFLLGVWIILHVIKSGKLVFSKLAAARLSKYSFMVLVSSALTPLTFLVIRNMIISFESQHVAGIWDGVNKISNNYIMLVTMSFGYYFLPTFSSITNNRELRKEIFSAYKILVPVLFLGVVIIYLLKEPVIHLLFSEQFYQMKEIIKWQLLGDFFKILSWVIGILIIAKEKVTAFIITELTSVLLQISLAYWLVGSMGIEGSTMYYFVENVLYFTLMAGVFVYYWGNLSSGK